MDLEAECQCSLFCAKISTSSPRHPANGCASDDVSSYDDDPGECQLNYALPLLLFSWFFLLIIALYVVSFQMSEYHMVYIYSLNFCLRLCLTNIAAAYDVSSNEISQWSNGKRSRKPCIPPYECLTFAEETGPTPSLWYGAHDAAYVPTAPYVHPNAATATVVLLFAVVAFVSFKLCDSLLKLSKLFTSHSYPLSVSLRVKLQ